MFINCSHYIIVDSQQGSFGAVLPLVSRLKDFSQFILVDVLYQLRGNSLLDNLRDKTKIGDRSEVLEFLEV